MKRKIVVMVFIMFISMFGYNLRVMGQMKGMESITAEERKFHLKFLAADEFQGRNTPSNELKIASKYIALMAERYGLKPLMPEGFYFQEIPLRVYTISEAKSYIRLTTEMSEQTFFYPRAFGVRGRNISEGHASGQVVFLLNNRRLPSGNRYRR